MTSRSWFFTSRTAKRTAARKHDPEAQVLVATDAAGEGTHLRRAHLAGSVLLEHLIQDAGITPSG